jgi:hypothetical protein
VGCVDGTGVITSDGEGCIVVGIEDGVNDGEYIAIGVDVTEGNGVGRNVGVDDKINVLVGDVDGLEVGVIFPNELPEDK